MNLSSKRFRVKSLTQRTDTGLFGDQPVQTKYTRVMLEEDAQQRDGDSITIISHDDSMDGFGFALGDTYEIALIPRTEEVVEDHPRGHGGSTHPAHPAPQPPMGPKPEEVVENHETGINQGRDYFPAV